MPVIFAFVEARDGHIRRISEEVVTAARTVADSMSAEVHALLLGGAGIEREAGGLGVFGADKIFVAEGPDVSTYSSEAYTTIVTDFVKDHACEVAIFGASAMGKDLAPRVAARLGVGYVADCMDLAVEGGRLVASHPRYAGKLLSRVTFARSPAVLSVRANVFTPVQRPAPGVVEQVPFRVDPAGFGAILKEIRASAGKKADVGEAAIVVSGGRGLRDPENFKLLEDLAEALGGAVGASRAVVDAGWRPHAEQVGQTGKTVSPQLYFAIGISGAIQHLAGMRTSRYIVAINKDPDAPIFKIADYGIVGDLFEVVPRLTQEVRKLRT